MSETKSLEGQIHELYIQFLHLQEEQEKRERDVFLAELQQSIGEQASFHLTDIHVLACIGKHEPINVTSIAERMSLSKGSISKINAKLLKEGWIRRTQLSDNKKEIYFRLTPAGKKIFLRHEELHEEAKALYVTYLQRYPDDQLRFIKQLLVDGISAIEGGQLHLRKMK
ncbi:MarR family transcriptional regulator [Paenibacillus aquistagni]|uniref:MarR family transcriptional regulator n=1 Tax=Paenibacillus aquistagni TaxID=1852522 RepID=UPI00145B4CC2|nr:MarR family transcriptional regulator [Paenibacillus aquistagni]NMM51298.1 MarR family transcriptional regulator [Paenibacillus aquistagni]